MRSLFRRLAARRPLLRSRPRVGKTDCIIQALEDRTLLTTPLGTHDIEVVGRTANGGWWASGYDFSQNPLAEGTIENAVFAVWSADVGWQHVRFGDFDGDGLQDVVGRDPATGYWWTTLSDMIGSTTVVGTRWSTATTWSDVGVVDLAPLGDRGDQGHFTNKSDIVGRSADGGWWAAVANGDGTFTNVLLGHWSPTAGWRDTQFLDINSDGATDVVSRNAAEGWWGLVSRGEVIAYDTVRLGGWSPTAGWQDVVTAQSFFREGDDAIVGRASDGAWWALDLAADGTAMNRFVTLWNEAAGWANVVAADLDGDGRDEVVGQTADGEWWRIVPQATPSQFIGWTALAPGIYVADDVPNAVHPANGIAITVDALTFRTADGFWWAEVLDQEVTGMLKTISIGQWDANAGWQNIAAVRVSRLPVFETVEALDAVPSVQLHAIHIFGHRAGTTVTSETMYASGPLFNDAKYVVNYVVPATGFSHDFQIPFGGKFFNVRRRFEFNGHYGADSYAANSFQPSIALGNAGNDRLDGRNGLVVDQLFGGDGLDVLLGDQQDVLVQ